MGVFPEPIAVHLLVLPEESGEQSNSYKPEPQTDWRWAGSDQMLFDVRSIWNMCPRCWTDSRPWPGSHTAPQVSELFRALCISLQLCEKDRQCEFFFFIIIHSCAHMWECFEHLEWVCQCRSKRCVSVVLPHYFAGSEPELLLWSVAELVSGSDLSGWLQSCWISVIGC